MAVTKGLSKRFLHGFAALIFISSFMLLQAVDCQKAKADGVDVLGKIISYVVGSTGEAVEYDVDPALGLAMQAYSISHGMQYSSKDQADRFVQGFMDWVHNEASFQGSGTAAQIKNTLQNYITLTQTAGKTAYVLDTNMTKFIREYIDYLKGADNASYCGNFSNVTLSSSSGQGVNFSYSLLTNSNYIFSLSTTTQLKSLALQLTATQTGSTVYTVMEYIFDSSGNCTVDQENEIQVDSSGAWRLYSTSNSNRSFSGSQPLILGVKWINEGQLAPSGTQVAVNASVSTLPSNIGNTNSVCPDSTGTQAINLDNSIDDSKPYGVTIPDASVDAIPSTAVVGQTSTTVDTAITGAIPGTTVGSVTSTGTTTGDTIGNPPWSEPGSHSIDWSPLLNLDMYDKFPFSIPWDLKSIATSLVATPEAPDFKFSVPMSGLHLPDWSIDIDFSKYEGPVKVIRWGLLLMVTAGLAFCFYKIARH